MLYVRHLISFLRLPNKLTQHFFHLTDKFREGPASHSQEEASRSLCTSAWLGTLCSATPQNLTPSPLLCLSSPTLWLLRSLVPGGQGPGSPIRHLRTSKNQISASSAHCPPHFLPDSRTFPMFPYSLPSLGPPPPSPSSPPKGNQSRDTDLPPHTCAHS